MLPEYIHMHVAESILFAGKAIRVLRNPGPAFKSQDVIAHHPSATDSYQVKGLC
ncbi:hypothetical protein QJS10_CPB20g01980 [Acorus calamus]|uniref:Uncharacterized protein n=1 Tax=Acorus calamus TaxID=4465 RepID=A0AAV9C8N4_ACOCL|nr:hypothetical protein QJS10_CPB20g01980 [Acorus calamus]